MAGQECSRSPGFSCLAFGLWVAATAHLIEADSFEISVSTTMV